MPLGIDSDEANESHDEVAHSFIADLSQSGNVAFLKNLMHRLAQKDQSMTML